MSRAILWMGPVSTAQFGKVPEGWTLLTIGDVVLPAGRTAKEGTRPSDFRAFYASLGSDPLGELLRRANASSAILVSFSAGHGLLEKLLEKQANDPRIEGVILGDSYYGLDVHPGSFAFAQRALVSGVPFWITTSNAKDGTLTVHSGSESVLPFANALGLPSKKVPSPPFVAGAIGRGQGGVLWADYEGRITHQQHALRAADLARFLAGSGSSTPSTGSRKSSGDELGTLALLVAGGFALYYASKRGDHE